MFFGVIFCFVFVFGFFEFYGLRFFGVLYLWGFVNVGLKEVGGIVDTSIVYIFFVYIRVYRFRVFIYKI